MKRASGILFPVFSLPSRYGIGCLSKEAYSFVDFLEKSGQSYWQILPIGPTGFGDSPYQAFSAFAGNPYFICLEDLIEEGLLTWDEVNSADMGSDPERVDYGRLYENRLPLLAKAHERFIEKKLNEAKEYKEYLEKEAFWLEDYIGMGWSFVLVTAIHLLFFYLAVHFRKSWIEKPIVHFLADLMLSK